MTELRVGQKLLYVEYTFGRDTTPRIHDVEIVKIGRRWAKLGDHHGRIDRKTMVMDGNGLISLGRCYFSLEHYEVALRTEDLWRLFCKQIRWKVPPILSVESIQSAATALGIDLDERERDD